MAAHDGAASAEQSLDRSSPNQICPKKIDASFILFGWAATRFNECGCASEKEAPRSGHLVVSAAGSRATFIWTGLPDYATAHHLGIRVPRRSPVMPNTTDRRRFIAVMQKSLQAAMGRGRTG